MRLSDATLRWPMATVGSAGSRAEAVEHVRGGRGRRLVRRSGWSKSPDGSWTHAQLLHHAARVRVQSPSWTRTVSARSRRRSRRRLPRPGLRDEPCPSGPTRSPASSTVGVRIHERRRPRRRRQPGGADAPSVQVHAPPAVGARPIGPDPPSIVRGDTSSVGTEHAHVTHGSAYDRRNHGPDRSGRRSSPAGAAARCAARDRDLTSASAAAHGPARPPVTRPRRRPDRRARRSGRRALSCPDPSAPPGSSGSSPVGTLVGSP